MKLILIEGIPGSGKTTTAQMVHDYYRQLGKKVVKYQEGDLHPVDLAWCAVFDEDAYTKVCHACDDVLDQIKLHTKILDDKYVVAYTHIGLPMKDERIRALFEPREIYGGHVDKETFLEIHKTLWQSYFAKKHDEDVTIFECVYLQNHITELMLTYNCDQETIIHEVLNMLPHSDCIQVELIYLDNDDVKETIDRVAAERRSTDKNKWDDWIDLVIKYIGNSKYGQLHGSSTPEDVYSFFEKRLAIEHAVLEKLPIKTHIVPNPDFDWQNRWENIKNILPD